MKQIARNRREYETKLSRRISVKKDYLRYIEYESTLHALKQKRIERLSGKQKKSELDYASLRIIYGVFDRALRKFGADDLKLWFSYIEMAKANGSDKVVSRVLSKAIQMHPRTDQFWLLAADWEYFHLGNVTSARALMQRGIRLNPESRRLWIEYYRLEWIFLSNIRKRREILGIDEKKNLNGDDDNDGDEDSKGEIDVPMLEGEKEDSEQLSSDAKESFLGGAVPKLVLNNAFKAIPDEFDFFKQMLMITRMFSGSESVQEFIYQQIFEKFNEVPACRAFLAERFIYDFTKDHPEYSSRLKETLAEYSQAIEVRRDLMHVLVRFD